MKSQKKTFCPNMNHSKTNPTISFCPNCGERFQSTTKPNKSCTDESHARSRRDRSLFCPDCGKDLQK
jgi:hypothetical protein